MIAVRHRRQRRTVQSRNWRFGGGELRVEHLERATVERLEGVARVGQRVQQLVHDQDVDKHGDHQRDAPALAEALRDDTRARAAQQGEPERWQEPAVHRQLDAGKSRARAPRVRMPRRAARARTTRRAVPAPPRSAARVAGLPP